MVNDEDLEPNYFAVIPAKVRYAQINDGAKLLYGEITALTNTKGYCYASNDYFAKLYKRDKSTISRWVSILQKNGFINIEIIRDERKQVIERRIYIIDSQTIDIKQKKDKTEKKETVKEVAEETTTEEKTENKTEKKTVKNKKVPLLEREPENELEVIEKKYLQNYMALKKKGLVKTDMPIVNWLVARRLENEAIQKYGLENILMAVEKSIESDFVVQKGYCLTMILSAGVLANLINGNNRNKNQYGFKTGQGIDAYVDNGVEF